MLQCVMVNKRLETVGREDDDHDYLMINNTENWQICNELIVSCPNAVTAQTLELLNSFFKTLKIIKT